MKKSANNKFTYNDGVIVRNNAPKRFSPGEIGIICGMGKIMTIKGAKEYCCQQGEWVYIVEFLDGSSIEIPESYLEADPERLKYCLRDRVKLRDDIPKNYHPSEKVLIIGYQDIEDENLAQIFELKLGDVIYVVKAENNEEFLVPESFIEKKIE
ncbi:MAG: hypothetical protein Tsb0015_13120 [Simkaniaceae bacterium]